MTTNNTEYTHRMPTHDERLAMHQALTADSFIALDVEDLGSNELRNMLTQDDFALNGVIETEGLLVFCVYGLCAIRVEDVDALVAEYEARD
jgi:hypothetical protein